MDHRSFALLATRLTGLVVIATVLLAFPNLYLYVAAGRGDYGGVEPVLLLFVVALLLGAALLAWPGRVADRLVGVVAATNRVDPAFLQEVALVSIGVYFICDSLLDGAYIASKLRLYYVLLPTTVRIPSPELAPEDFAAVVTALVRLAIGVGLVVGANGAARVLARLRA